MTDFDFGFTAVNEDELEAVTEVAESSKIARDKLDELYNAIMPLLTNLQNNPEKDYIFWPGRLEKVEEFRDHLTKIYKGQHYVDWNTIALRNI